jgi:hypothetical protein
MSSATTSTASEAHALGDIMSESMGGIISDCPGDFVGIRRQDRRVALAYVDVDYRRRLPPEDIIATLRSLPALSARRAGTSMR